MHRALRSLTFFWKPNLAVALGAAVAATVLTGAMLTGDSVRGSLRDLTLDRLGGIDLALVREGFFREELARDLAGRKAAAAPAIVLRGTAVHGSSQARAAGIAIYGIDQRFTELFGADLPALKSGSGGIFPPLIVNESLRRELGAKPGDDVLLAFARPGEIPRETLLGEKEADDVLASRRFTLVQVLPDRGLGRFGLTPNQGQPLNAFVPLTQLQDAVEREGRVNALFAAALPEQGSAQLRGEIQLEDLGLRLVRSGDQVSLESTELFLNPAAVETAEALARQLGATPSRVFTYLATRLQVRGQRIPYSMVSGLSILPNLKDGEILLNRWTADDLQARPGDRVEMTYLAMAPGGGLTERTAAFRLGGVLEMAGLGADRTLTPSFPGIEDAKDMAAWDPPFPVDYGAIRPRDEQYWDDYGAAPKAFVSLATAQRLWGTRFGNLTAVRIQGGDPARIETTLRRELPRRVALAPFGMAFRPVKQEGLAAAAGSTDFAELFLAFSFFLIVAAVLLVGLLFSLAVERRASELGLLLATGYRVRDVRRQLLAEGALLTGLGALIGLAGAMGYAWLIMAGLRSWWLPAVGTPYLFLHVQPSTLAAGWLVSVLAVLFAVAFAVRRLAKLPPAALLAGATAGSELRRSGRLARLLATGGAALGLVLLLYATLSGESSSPALFFGIGACLLASGLALCSLWFQRPRPWRHANLAAMAARNVAANPGRSLISVALVACACFVLVAVAANRRSAGGEVREGAGGFPLFAESAVPLVEDPGGAEGRLALGLSAEDESALRGTSILSFRVVPGDDVSCLNLYQPRRPRLLGVPADLAHRGGFRFGQTVKETPNPWLLLEENPGTNVIPAIADANSATWILKLELGQDLALTDEAGRPVRLRLVGLLERSLFQSELLVSEPNLLRHFPSLAGRSFFLIDASAERTAGVTHVLEEGLGRFGFDVSTTAARLSSYHAVEDTYLSTFQALGEFGLLLGTLGLGIALLRNLLERRGELAALRAFGFRRRRLAWMVVAENGFLLLLGVGLGTLSGLLAVAPHLAAGGGSLPWPPLIATLFAVVAAGFVSCGAAVWSTLRAPLLPVLKEER